VDAAVREKADRRLHRSGAQRLQGRIEAQNDSHFDPFGHRLATDTATAALWRTRRFIALE